jgi:8-oxo-dGTP pyrophosphatase MutT (NUDIX family)
MDLSRVAAHRADHITGEDRDAAVLVPVVERADGSALLFTKRADHLGEHPGQMSFPGGGRESGDEDLRATATREANEEIGLQREELSYVGQLDDISTVTRYAVTPFVGRIPDREYVPDEREVDEVVVLPVAALTDPANYELEKRIHPNYGEALVHFFHVDDYTVWGATARILVQFLELARDWTPPDRDPEVVKMEPDD